MKKRKNKYVMLFAFTFLIVGIIAGAGAVIRNSMVKSQVVNVSTITVEDSITCTGRVERIAAKSVYAPYTSIAKTVNVSVGDQVSAGDPLMDIISVSGDTSTETLQEVYQNFLNGQMPDTSKTKEDTVNAPISGEVTAVNVTDQGYLDPSKPAFVISSSSGLQVKLSVNESQISDIRVGQDAIITGVGFKDHAFSGKVKSISSEAKQVTSTTGQETVVEVIVSVDHETEVIKPGFSAKAQIITARKEDVLIVPYEAVQADENGNEYVYKLVDHRAVKTPIKTVNEFDNGFEVSEGVAKSDVLILNSSSVTDGAYIIASAKGEE